MKDFYYLTPSGHVVRINANRKPSPKTRPKSGTWKVMEFNGQVWAMATFPEITWGSLEKLKYIGSVAKPKAKGFAE